MTDNREKYCRIAAVAGVGRVAPRKRHNLIITFFPGSAGKKTPLIESTARPDPYAPPSVVRSFRLQAAGPHVPADARTAAPHAQWPPVVVRRTTLRFHRPSPPPGSRAVIMIIIFIPRRRSSPPISRSSCAVMFSGSGCGVGFFSFWPFSLPQTSSPTASAWKNDCSRTVHAIRFDWTPAT